jgi:hypothetical protein
MPNTDQSDERRPTQQDRYDNTEGHTKRTRKNYNKMDSSLRRVIRERKSSHIGEEWCQKWHRLLPTT